MGLKKRYIGITLLCLLVFVLVLGLRYKNIVKNTKIDKIESLFSEFEDDYGKQIDIMVELNKLKKDKDEEISKKAMEYHSKIEQIVNDKSIIDEVKSISIEDMADYMKEFRIENLLTIKSDSIYYDEAQSLISKLGGTKPVDTNNNPVETKSDSEIIIEYYSKHYSAGSEKLNIKLKNTSGQDIEYLALDILEVDKDGNVVNSDWTNTSALILNNASVSLDTYFDYQRSESDLNFRIKDIRYK